MTVDHAELSLNIDQSHGVTMHGKADVKATPTQLSGAYFASADVTWAAHEDAALTPPTHGAFS